MHEFECVHVLAIFNQLGFILGIEELESNSNSTSTDMDKKGKLERATPSTGYVFVFIFLRCVMSCLLTLTLFGVACLKCYSDKTLD